MKLPIEIKSAIDLRRLGSAFHGSPLKDPVSPQQAAVNKKFNAAYVDWVTAATYTETTKGDAITIEADHSFTINKTGHYLINFLAEYHASANANVVASLTVNIIIDGAIYYYGPACVYSLSTGAYSNVDIHAEQTRVLYLTAGQTITLGVTSSGWGGAVTWSGQKYWAHIVKLD